MEPCFWAKNAVCCGVVLTNINPLVVEDGPFRQDGKDGNAQTGCKKLCKSLIYSDVLSAVRVCCHPVVWFVRWHAVDVNLFGPFPVPL